MSDSIKCRGLGFVSGFRFLDVSLWDSENEEAGMLSVNEMRAASCEETDGSTLCGVIKNIERVF